MWHGYCCQTDFYCEIAKVGSEVKNTGPSCLVSTVETADGDVVVWGRFSLQTLGPLVVAEDQHNIAAPACGNNFHDVCGVWTQNAD